MKPQDPLSQAEQSSGPSDEAAKPQSTASPSIESSHEAPGAHKLQTDRPGASIGRVSPGDGSGGSDAGGGPRSEEASEAVREHSGGRLNRP